MKSNFAQLICRLLVVSLVVLPFQSVQAGMIGADQVAATHSAQADRHAVLGLVGRADVARQLQTLGLDPQSAKDRVAAMTDDEIRSLAGRLDTLPAGASSGWAIAIVIAIGVLLWYNWR